MGATIGNPADKLTPAEPKERMQDLAEQILSAPDWVSPGHWFWKAVGMLCDGKNPMEESAKVIAGDWEGLAKSAAGLQKIADYYEANGSLLGLGKNQVMSDWTGNAADSAADYFGTLGAATQDQVKPIRDFAVTCDNTATSIYLLAKAITSGFEALTDYVIDTGIALAAGAITSETGVGAILGGAAAAYTAWRGNQEWLDIAGNIGKIEAAVGGLTGAATGAISGISGMTQVQMPKGAYDDPQADGR